MAADQSAEDGTRPAAEVIRELRATHGPRHQGRTEPAEYCAVTWGALMPHRDDQFAAWLKRSRDECRPDSCRWRSLDDLLDDYRLHADTDTPLDRQACEGPGCGPTGEAPTSETAPVTTCPLDGEPLLYAIKSAKPLFVHADLTWHTDLSEKIKATDWETQP